MNRDNVFSGNVLSSKCYLPSSSFAILETDAGELVTVKLNSATVTNCIYPQILPLGYVETDDAPIPKTSRLLSDFQITTCFPLKKIAIRVVFKNFEALSKLKCPKTLKLGVSHILQEVVVFPTFSLNCSGHRVAEIHGISRIDVTDISGSAIISGKVVPQTDIEINGVTSEEYLKQLSRFSEQDVGGFDGLLSSLRHSMQTLKSFNTPLLLTGPSGCGKSMLLKKLAYLTNNYLLVICANDLISQTMKTFSKLYSQLYQLCHLPYNLPCIIFYDRLDVLSTKAGKTVLHLVLCLLDVTSKFQDFTVLGAATSSKAIHPSLKTVGRFNKEIHIGVPTQQQREDILNVLMSGKKSSINASEIANRTPGYLGRDLSLLCMAAENSTREDANHSTSLSNEHFKKALEIVKPSILKDSLFRVDIHSLNWSHIGGMQKIKKQIEICIKWPLLYPQVFAKVGLPQVHGVLLFGPPGCCKTTLIRLLATECKMNFVSASPAQIFGPFFGDSEKSIFEIFHQARLCAPSVVFLDEIDSIVGKRSHFSKHSGIQEKVLSCLLTEMDGFGSDLVQGVGSFRKQTDFPETPNLVVVGATNRIDLIDDALLRPGRFDVVLYVPPPNVEEREAILRTLTKKMEPENINFKWLAESTNFFSGADLQNLCRMAALKAIKRCVKVTQEHFLSALSLSTPSITEAQLHKYEELAKKYGPTLSLQKS